MVSIALVDARKTSLTGVQNSKKNRLAATRLGHQNSKKNRLAAGANPFRNVGGTPSGVDPFFGLEGGGGGGEVRKMPPQKNRRASRANSQYKTTR